MPRRSTTTDENGHVECVPLCGIWLGHVQHRLVQRLAGSLSQSAPTSRGALQRRLLRLQ